MKAYQVTVKTTNAVGGTTYGPGKGQKGKEPYRDCDNGILYVVTDDPVKIFDEFPSTTAIKEVGIGYVL